MPDPRTDPLDDAPTDALQQEALTWFVRLRDAQATPADRAAFERWLAQGPAHAAAFARAERLWRRFDLMEDTMREGRRQRGHSRRAVLSGLGALALAGGGGAWWASRPGRFADYATDIGQRRSITLPDGSQVELGTWSALDLAFTPTERRVVLHRGEAHFTVHVDEPFRPFIVEAGPGTTRALGTRFDVKRLDDAVTVAVDEHTVEVRVGGRPAVPLGTGFEVSYDTAGVGPVRPADLDAVQAWRQDRLVFSDLPLARVLAELERYRRGRILLADRSLGAVPVSGVFDTRQSEAALRTIAETLSLTAVGTPGVLTVLWPSG